MLSELKAQHLATVASDELRIRSANLPVHELGAAYLTDPPNLMSPLAPSGTPAIQSTMGMIRSADAMAALMDDPAVAQTAEDRSFHQTGLQMAGLRRLRTSVDELCDAPLPSLDSLQTVSQTMMGGAESEEKPKKRLNGWTLFWKEKEKSAERWPGETSACRRRRVLDEASQSWAATLPPTIAQGNVHFDFPNSKFSVLQDFPSDNLGKDEQV